MWKVGHGSSSSGGGYPPSPVPPTVDGQIPQYNSGTGDVDWTNAPTNITSITFGDPTLSGTIGAFRTENNVPAYSARNFLDADDVVVLGGVDASDRAIIGGTGAGAKLPTSLVYQAATDHHVKAGGTTRLTISATQALLAVPLTSAGTLTYDAVTQHEVKIGGTTKVTYAAGLTQLTTDVAVGTAPAGSGAMRMTNDAKIAWRNAANSADIAALYVDGSNIVQIGVGSAGVTLNNDLTLIPGADIKLANNRNLYGRKTDSSYHQLIGVTSSDIISIAGGAITLVAGAPSLLAFTYDGAGYRITTKPTGLVGTEFYFEIPVQAAAGEPVAQTQGTFRFSRNSLIIAARNNNNDGDQSILSVAGDSVLLNSGSTTGVGAGSGTLYLQCGGQTVATCFTNGAIPALDEFGVRKPLVMSSGKNIVLQGASTIRTPNNTTILTARNAANTADISVIGTNASDQILIGGSVYSAPMTPAYASMYQTGGTMAGAGVGSPADITNWDGEHVTASGVTVSTTNGTFTIVTTGKYLVWLSGQVSMDGACDVAYQLLKNGSAVTGATSRMQCGGSNFYAQACASPIPLSLTVGDVLKWQLGTDVGRTATLGASTYGLKFGIQRIA